jgi:thiamine pyrophosphate-dependent acetolactate synthase large subunit-like protein
MAYAPVTSLTPLARYEKVVEAFGGKGYFVSKPADLLPTLRTAFAQTVRVLSPWGCDTL